MRLIVAPQMLEQLSSFTEFYKKKHENRVLSWDHALGNASVVGNFKGGKKELLVSLYQAIALLQFNENSGGIGYNEIKAATGIRKSHSVSNQATVANQFAMPHDQFTADMDLKRTLQSLACGKQKVLKKKPVGADVNESDVFHFNDDYTNQRYQVRIDSIQAKETVRRIVPFETSLQRTKELPRVNDQPEETKRTEAWIEADRKQELDAAIVRIMKGKKKLTFEQIKAEVIVAVKQRFLPEIKHIKHRVDYLVENEYLKRDDAVKDVFVYLA